MPVDAVSDRAAPSHASGGRLARSAGLAGVATLTSRILGLVRESVQAALFGAGNEVDAFLVAFRIPNLARDLFAEGAMSASFVPTFTRHLTMKSRADAMRLANNVLATLIAVTGAVVVLAMVFADPLVRLYAGDYADVPGKFELTVWLTRVMLPIMVLIAVAAVLMGMLNSLQHYFIPALSPAMFNVASILSMAVLVPLMPSLGWPPVMAVAIGAVLGGIGQIAVQWPALRREGFSFRPFIDRRDDGLRRILALMGPGVFGLAATQINLFVNTLLATQQGTGAVSWLTYAFRLMYLPIGLFGVSIATAVLPAAARHAARGERAAMGQVVSRGLALMLTVNIPAMFGLIVLAEPISRILFERGRFLAADTAATAAALQFYAVGLVGYAAARIVSPVFYAIDASRVPVTVSAVSIAVNVAASLVLVRLFGFRGLALSTSIAALVNGGALLWLARRAVGDLNEAHLAKTLVKTLVAAVAMAVTAFYVNQWMETLLNDPSLPSQALRLAAAITAGVSVLAVSGVLMGIREFRDVAAMIGERLRRARTTGAA